MTAPPKKKPVTKRNLRPDPKVANLPVAKRMAAAVAAVMNGTMSQSEAAVRHGVSRSRVNVNVQEAKKAAAEQQRRSEMSAAERRGEAPTTAYPSTAQILKDGFPVRDGAVIEEVRRVPPFAEFDAKYFGGLECFDCGKHHETPAFHTEMMDAINNPDIKRLLINCPPGHSKSTIGTVKSTVYELCRDPNSITALVSKSQKLAEKFLYSIGRYLTDPALYDNAQGNLIDDWGPFQSADRRGSDPWSGQQFYVAGRQSAEKDPSVSAYGVGGHIYGIRAHRMIMDDVADLENQKNAERVTEMLAWCTQEAGSRVGRHGKLIFIGTRVSPNDIYSQLQQLPGYHVIRYPCITDEFEKTTLWPDHYAFEDAERQRDSMTTEQWQLVYQNVDTPGLGASFTPEVIEANYDNERTLGMYDPNWALVVGLDPAGSGAQAGYTAFTLWGIDVRTSRRYLVDLANVKQMKAPDIMNQLYEWADKYPLREVRVEVNGLQGQIFQYNTELLARLTNKGVRLAPHVTHGRNKWDSEFGVESMATMFINNMVSLPTRDVASRNKIRALTDQLVAFPMGRHSDLVMSSWFAELGMREILNRATVPMFDPRFKAPNRIMRRRHVIDFGEKTVTAPTAEMVSPNGRPLFPGRDVKEPVRFVNMGGSITPW